MLALLAPIVGAAAGVLGAIFRLVRRMWNGGAELWSVPADRTPIHSELRRLARRRRGFRLEALVDYNALAALGVVFGDIGTSPHYAVRQSLIDFGDMSEHAILGALSLIVWALVLIVMVKYVLVIMRADNRGEGGTVGVDRLGAAQDQSGAQAIFMDHGCGPGRRRTVYGDGVITPAISVLSAVEGLKVATPFFDPYVVPISSP